MTNTPHSAIAARTAAIHGTRALVAETTFEALMALLVLCGAVPKEKARGFLVDVADQLAAHQEAGHSDWQVHPAELALHADRLRRQAEAMG